MADQLATGRITPSEAVKILKTLDRKHTQVLDLLLQQRTSKEIARELGVSPNTVDMRVKVLKDRFDLPERADLVRLYAFLTEICGRTTCGSIVVDQAHQNAFHSTSEMPTHAVFTLRDSVALGSHPNESVTLALLEAFDQRFGKLGRFGLIIGMAIALTILILLILAVASTLGEIV